MPADIPRQLQPTAAQTVAHLGAIIEWVRKLPITRYITIYLVFGLVLSALSLWAFSEIAENVTENDALIAFDLLLANELYEQATPFSTNIYRFISWFGSEAVWFFGIGVGLIYFLRQHWLKLVFWIITLAGGGILNALLKNFFARPRPIFTDPYVIEQHYSFPSAHSMMSLILYGMIAYLLWREIRDRSTRYIIVFDAVLLTVLIGISRMTLGVHYLADVLGGFAAGGIWLGACITGLNFIQQHTEYQEQFLQVAASGQSAVPQTDG